MREQILDWLNDNGITNPNGLTVNGDFIAFLKDLFPNRDEEEIRKKVFQFGIAYTNIQGFAGGLSTALSN